MQGTMSSAANTNGAKLAGQVRTLSSLAGASG